MSKKIYFVGVKRYYTQVVEEKLFKKPTEEKCWCIFNERAVYAHSKDEAIKKYKEQYPRMFYGLSEAAKSSDNFDWFRRRTRLNIADEYVISNPRDKGKSYNTHSIEWLMKNMDYRDFKDWFFHE